MKSKKRILCIGEILWDALPAGLFLGGAPLNVCYHLNQFGIEATISSKIGDDRLGKEALCRIKHKGISTGYIQSDSNFETGYVKVEIEGNGAPVYDIFKPVAWDFIESTPELQELAKTSWGLVFGSLAQRHRVSRETIRRLWNYDLTKILDLNLRDPFAEKGSVNDSLRVADIVKMNEEELSRLRQWFSLPGDLRESVEELVVTFDCSLVCITKGAGGAVMYQEGNWYEHTGYPVQSKDSVGSGDAFLAAIIYGIQTGKRGYDLLEYANAAGSMVARKSGATPEYDIEDVKHIIGAGP